MFPREHLPLTLVTVALLGMLFILYRELNVVKSAVAHLSVPVIIEEQDKEEDSAPDVSEDEKSSPPALESPKKIKSSH